MLKVKQGDARQLRYVLRPRIKIPPPVYPVCGGPSSPKLQLVLHIDLTIVILKKSEKLSVHDT